MKNDIELAFIQKIMEDNLLYLKTKIKINDLTDPIVKTMFFEIGKAISTFGEFIPSKHLQPLLTDKNRMENYKKLNYPLELTSVSNIMEFLNKHKQELRFSTLERTIKENSIRKEMAYISEKMMLDISDSKKSIADVIRKYSYSIDSLKYENEDRLQFMSASDIVAEEKKRLLSDEKVSIQKSGFNFIDNIAGGVTAPSLISVVASSGVGKSIWLYDLTVRQLKMGKKVLFGTVEIPAKEAYMKILSRFTGIKYHNIWKKEMSKVEKEQYMKGLEEFEKLKENLYIIYDETGVAPNDIKHYYKNLEKCGIECDVICVDYLGLLKSNDSSASEGDRYAKLPKQLRLLSQETNSIVYCPHQLKTQSATKEIESLEPSNIYYAMPLMHEATLAYFMTRKKDEGVDITLVRNFKSRIGDASNTYVFRNTNRDYINLGEDEVYDNINF